MKQMHTQGPLEYVISDDGARALITESDGTTVADLSTVQNTTAHAALEANVQLWCQANELVQVLEEIAKRDSHGTSGHFAYGPYGQLARTALNRVVQPRRARL